jgi:AAA ATPase domain
VLLISAHVTNYRSVEDSEQFAIEPDVTCLVGKNEGGKTAVQQAIYRSRPVEASAKFDEVIDFPARLTKQRKNWGEGQRIPVVKLGFQFDADEIQTIEEDLGAGALRSPEFTVTRGYRSTKRVFEVQPDEAAIVQHLRTRLDISFGPHPAVANASTIAAFYRALQEMEEPPASVTKMLARIESWRGQEVDLYIIDKYADPWMPKFVYFDDYDSMPGKVSIPHLIRKRDADTLSRGERALLSLLNLAGVTPEDFHQADQHERLIRELENAGNVISDEVFDYWSQNDQLEVKLEVLPPEAGAEAPLDEGPILQVRVHNRRHRASVPFDERSRGFVWFFSFLAYFNEVEESTAENLILLLDEPGLSLHGRAQQDLLRLIDDRLAPKHQVIYTTHSPFMVSPDHLHRVRTVIDHDKVGTKVSAEIFKADEDTAFPLLTAMGIEMTQTLFIGEHTLLLEGPSDLIYLDVLTEVLERQGRPGLDARWVKTPIGGAGKLSTFVTLLGANKLHVAVVVDSSTKDVGAIKRLRENGQLGRRNLLEISEFTGTADADIEDLFLPDFYPELVNRAYAKELSAPITVADLNPHDPRIVRQVETYFRDHAIAGGQFNHYRPAATLLREQTSLIPQINTVTLTRAEQLFTRLNDLLP